MNIVVSLSRMECFAASLRRDLDAAFRVRHDGSRGFSGLWQEVRWLAAVVGLETRAMSMSPMRLAKRAVA